MDFRNKSHVTLSIVTFFSLTYWTNFHNHPTFARELIKNKSRNNLPTLFYILLRLYLLSLSPIIVRHEWIVQSRFITNSQWIYPFRANERTQPSDTNRYVVSSKSSTPSSTNSAHCCVWICRQTTRFEIKTSLHKKIWSFSERERGTKVIDQHKCSSTS